MAIVEEYKIGNTIIKIFDNAYRDKTSEELEDIWKRVEAICWKIVLISRAAGKDI